MSRELPLFDDDQHPVAFPSIATWCVMHFPDDIATARQSTVALSNEQLEMRARRQVGYSQVGLDIATRIRRRTQGARLVGLETLQVLQNLHERGEPNLSRARWVVSEWASTLKDNSGRPLPSDEKELGQKSKIFRSVAHLWAAFEALEEEKRNGFPEDTSCFQDLLLIASVFERRLLETGALDIKEKGWNPWLVPESFLARFAGQSMQVSIAPESEWIKDKLKEYVPRRVRDSG